MAGMDTSTVLPTGKGKNKETDKNIFQKFYMTFIVSKHQVRCLRHNNTGLPVIATVFIQSRVVKVLYSKLNKLQ